MLSYRQIHLDFHTSEHIEHIGKDFDGERFAKRLKKANVDSITCFARCHHGNLYYPSKHQPERIHPHLDNKNLLIEQIDACHAQNIKAPIYTTVQWDAYIAREYPQWLAVDGEGNHINSQNVAEPHFYYTICLNSGYRKYFKDHLQDIIDSVGIERIDGFFMDILFKTDCNCPVCQEKMAEKNMDSTQKENRIEYSLLMLNEFKTEITAFIQERVPGVGIFYNSSHIGPAIKNNLDAYTHLELESLPSGGWGYMHFPTTVRYARHLDKEILGMTGKFHTYWGDFHSVKNQAALEYECFQMLAMNAGCSVGDQLHPLGELSEAGYSLIEHVYGQVAKKEPYCFGAKAITEIGVLTPEEFYTSKDHDLGLPPSLMGTVRILQELSLQFDIIDSEMDFSKYKLLILPDHIQYSTYLNERLENYIRQGGKVLGSYQSNLDLSGQKDNVFGVRYHGESPYDRDFILPNEVVASELFPEPYVMYEKGAAVEADKAQILMSSVKPYFNREGDTYCSHQHAPSSGQEGTPAVTRLDNAIYISHPIFTIYNDYCPKWCKIVVRDLIHALIGSGVVSHNGPSTLLTTLNHQEEHNRDVLHLLHYIIEKRAKNLYTVEDVHALNALDISVYVGDQEVKRVYNVTTEKDIDFKCREDYIDIFNYGVKGHEMICIQY